MFRHASRIRSQLRPTSATASSSTPFAAFSKPTSATGTTPSSQSKPGSGPNAFGCGSPRFMSDAASTSSFSSFLVGGRDSALQGNTPAAFAASRFRLESLHQLAFVSLEDDDL